MPRRLSALRLSLLFLLAACGQVQPPAADLAVTAPLSSDIVAWGDNSLGQTTVPALPEGLSYTEIAGGKYHNLALRSDGQVLAWGYGETNVPALPAGVSYTAVAGGNDHSLAVRSDGQVVGWGYNG